MGSRRPAEFEHHPWRFGQCWGATFVGGRPAPTYRGVVRRVVDGDTFDVLIDLGFGMYAYETIRLADINAPEVYHPKSDAERVLGQQAMAFAVAMLQGQPVVLTTAKDVTTFGRYVANLYYSDTGEWRDFGQELVAHHLTELDV